MDVIQILQSSHYKVYCIFLPKFVTLYFSLRKTVGKSATDSGYAYVT